MKIVAWNCRGLSNNPTIQGLLNFQKSEQVDVLFLSKTKLKEKKMLAFKHKLNLGNMVVVDGEGKGGRELQCCGGAVLMCLFGVSQEITLTLWYRERITSDGS